MNTRAVFRTALLPAAAALMLQVTAAAPATYTVRPDGGGDFPTILMAVDAADTGDTIELTDGTFSGTGNRDISYYGKAITIRSQSGVPELCIIDCEGSDAAPHRGFIFTSGEGPGSVLEGVTITGGWISAMSCGGALMCRTGSSPTLVNCRFVDCEAGCAGGIWVQQSSPAITDCVFAGNVATNGGGGLFCTDASPTVEGCLFIGNSSEYESGAIGCNFAAAPTFDRCVFSGNACAEASVIRCDDETAATFTGCTFAGNAGQAGGAVIHGRDTATLTLVRSIIAFDSGGAAVECAGSGSATLTCCDVFGNPGGDWVGCIAGELGLDGNIAVDPLFCSATPGADRNWSLQSGSPCAPGNHPDEVDCDLIGARPVGCVDAVVPCTWGAIKGWWR